MSNLAEKLIEPAVDSNADDFEVIIQVRSQKHNCNVAYMMSQYEISNAMFEEIVRSLKYRMLDFIQEKLNAISQGKESQYSQRLQ